MNRTMKRSILVVDSSYDFSAFDKFKVRALNTEINLIIHLNGAVAKL